MGTLLRQSIPLLVAFFFLLLSSFAAAETYHYLTNSTSEQNVTTEIVMINTSRNASYNIGFDNTNFDRVAFSTFELVFFNTSKPDLSSSFAWENSSNASLGTGWTNFANGDDNNYASLTNINNVGGTMYHNFTIPISATLLHNITRKVYTEVGDKNASLYCRNWATSSWTLIHTANPTTGGGVTYTNTVPLECTQNNDVLATKQIIMDTNANFLYEIDAFYNTTPTPYVDFNVEMLFNGESIINRSITGQNQTMQLSAGQLNTMSTINTLVAHPLLVFRTNKDANETLQWGNLNYTFTHYAPLELNFTRNGAPAGTNGRITDAAQTIGMYGMNFTWRVNNLTTGNVRVEFGSNLTTNFTQYYDFYNDGLSTVTDVLELLPSPDWGVVVYVGNYGNAPIQGATVRIYEGMSSNGTQNPMRLIGQVITGPDGKAVFIADMRGIVMVEVNADGYEDISDAKIIGNFEYTETSPWNIYMTYQNRITSYDVCYPPSSTNNKSVAMIIPCNNFDEATITYTTDYRLHWGLPTKEAISDGKYKQNAYLEPGTDYDLLASTNITFIYYITKDGVLLRTENKTIEYIEPSTSMFPKTETENIPPAVFVIAIILITVFVGRIWQSESIGKNTFLTLGTLSVLVNGHFLFLAVICLIHPIGRIIARLIQD